MNKKNQKKEIFPPEESVFIIEKILEKYDLIKEEIPKEIINSKDGLSVMEFIENLPESKIANLVKNYSERKITIEEIPNLISKELEVDEKKGEEITKDLKENLLIFVKQVSGKYLIEKEEITIPKRITSLKKDIYKETVE